MAFRDLFDEELMRVRILLGAMLMAFGLLLAVLWHMQVARGTAYQQDLMKQSVRRVRMPGMRGRLFDRTGACIADNRPSYAIAIYLEELRQPGKWARTVSRVDQLIDELAAVLQLPRQITADDIRTHIRKRLPLPLLAWRDVDSTALARFAERAAGMPGVDVYPEAVREYPEGSKACHVLGYVGRAEIPEDEEESYHYYLPELAGKAGVEKTCDNLLRGRPGGQLMRVDVAGFRHDDLAHREPVNGSDVMLTLDMKAQALVEAALGQDAGAAVIIDPSNGDVLAMASSPGFDPNQFMPSISADQWRSLSEDPRKPLLNKATAGVFAPGSTFKPVVALAALENRKASAGTSFSCPGYFSLGRARFDCWYHPGHGTLNLREGIQHSCNVYFFHLGLLCGVDAIANMARALGFGRRTGILLDYESPGLVPDNAWKLKNFRDKWRDGDTCNLSIGQGALGATPVQMGLYAAALANGGTLYKPRLVAGVRKPGTADFVRSPPEVANELNWAPSHIRLVREGMHDVVMSPRGTGRLAAVPGVDMAGKTGTAEYGKKGEGHKFGWMIAFAPFDRPRYAIVMMVEEAVTGGQTVAPRMKQVMGGLFREDSAGEGEG